MPNLDQERALVDGPCFPLNRVRISARKTMSVNHASSAVTVAVGAAVWFLAVNNMDVSVLCLLTVALSFGPQPSSQISVIPKPKPGSCPPLNTYVRCITKCTADHHCKGNLKCCPSRCGQTCMRPALAERRVGACPRQFPTFPVEPCDDECTEDYECEPGLKCCFIDCGRRCVVPFTYNN
ncbi:hypothetical protein WMY93_030460 [Mugilogobius chulae]|uniref:WAP domain-containing protein n=1 Tax=Mugilogobius chulae TaxID=88201 RepID=A0AAW0MHJ4_9GOBI